MFRGRLFLPDGGGKAIKAVRPFLLNDGVPGRFGHWRATCSASVCAGVKGLGVGVGVGGDGGVVH